MKKLYTVKGWRGEDVEVLQSLDKKKISIVSDLFIVTYKVPPTYVDPKEELIQDIASYISLIEHPGKDTIADRGGYYGYNEDNLGMTIRLSKLGRDLEKKLLFRLKK